MGLIILMIFLTILLSISLIITIYVWLSVKIRLHKKVSYEQALNVELKEITKHHLQVAIYYKNKQIYQTISTRYGELDLYKFGNTNKFVIFVHGIWSNNRSVIKVVDYFVARGFTVIAYDNYGWGKSRRFGITTMGKKESFLLKDVIKFTKIHFQPHELFVYGESMGGATVYKFIKTFDSKSVDKFIVNAGYMSLFRNVINLGKKQLWYFIYLAYLPLLLVFWLQKWPIKPFLKKQELSKMTNVYHLHAIKDNLVSYDGIKKYLPYVKNHIYTNPNVRHVCGWYDAIDEQNKILDKWIKE